jgi:tRNA nucleotidyltransferase (CCA-adding enzyme)
MEPIKDICQAISNAGGRALMVGGAVRDMLLCVDPKDFDLEVFGLMPDEFVVVLEKFGKVEHRGLGKFPTYALRVGDMDVVFSSPRSDSKTGPKHSDFTVLIDPFMSIEDAARRRDFTINSMSFDPINGQLVDPFGGQEDLSAGMLAVTDEAHFGEDPLRVLRGMQFCGRMLLVSDRETDILCASLVDQAQYLSPSSVWGEWEK